MTVQLHLDGREQSERVCACGCGASLDGMRVDALWLSRAHAVRWARANPGKSLSEAYSANKGRTRKRRRPSERGVQVSYHKALRILTIHTGLGEEQAAQALKRALPERQRALLEQREAA